MKIFFSLATLFFCFIISAQDDFKKGYYIDNIGVKTEGYIKSSDFRSINDNSFTSFEFKTSLTQDAVKIEKNTIIELGSEKDVKLQKMRALLDDVSFYKDYSNDKGFSVGEQIVFLNVLVEGNATLFSYDGGRGVKFLWKRADQGEIAKQFLYKKFYRANLNLTENNAFREQLFNNVKCPNQEFTDFLKVKYEKEELISIFKNYNKCVDSPVIVYENDNEDKAVIKLSILAGYSLGNFRVTNIKNPTDPQNYSIYSAGVEGEVIFASRKMAMFASVEIKNGKGSTEKTSKTSELSTTQLRQVFTFDNYFADFIFGARFYKKISPTYTFFVGGGAGLHAGSGFMTFQQANTIDNELRFISNYPLSGSGFLTLHLGCKINKHWGIDVNYDSPKNLLNSAIGTSATVHEFGLNLRYML